MKKKTPAPKFIDTQGPESFEVYGRPSIPSYLATDSKPDSFNGRVHLERYRVTVEKIEEPIEAIHERLREIFAKVKGTRNADAVLAAAKEWGVVL